VEKQNKLHANANLKDAVAPLKNGKQAVKNK